MEDPSKQQPPPYPTQQGAGGFAPPPYPTQAPGVPPYPAQAPPPAGYKPPDNYGYSTQPGQVWKILHFIIQCHSLISQSFLYRDYFLSKIVCQIILVIFFYLTSLSVNYFNFLTTFLLPYGDIFGLSLSLEKYHKCFSKLKYDSQSSLRGSVNHQFIFIRDSNLHLMLIVL